MKISTFFLDSFLHQPSSNRSKILEFFANNAGQLTLRDSHCGRSARLGPRNRENYAASPCRVRRVILWCHRISVSSIHLVGKTKRKQIQKKPSLTQDLYSEFVFLSFSDRISKNVVSLPRSRSANSWGDLPSALFFCTEVCVVKKKKKCIRVTQIQKFHGRFVRKKKIPKYFSNTFAYIFDVVSRKITSTYRA